MKLDSFSDNLIQVDKTSSYIPIASTVTNLVDIFVKCTVIPLMKREVIQKNHYYAYHELGRSVPQDIEKAAQLFQQAADLGYPAARDALNNLSRTEGLNP